ncbi:outer surface protein C (plasmid) [Candidatus Borrelia fainii]|uniref:Outer surface protein C n=1 Tax=Candidatus Borrelia fainii TaxID=2518322 RepID=A0ABM8DLQ9_9SPIR|nr:Vsp/OspC family lipoprotein [Candidatus Borrelia fainii]BDU63527.1 outer surface protein C [Candidatus Borrelia fainii]
MKRITLSALLMTLFLLIGCNNGGAKEGAAIKADGSVIDLKKVSTDIENAVAFAADVKEVRTLVKSIDELAKAIGKKIQNADTLGNDAGKNTALIAGVFSVTLDIVKKAKALQIPGSIKEQQDLTQKVNGVTTAAETFIKKLKSKTAELGVADGATIDNNAKSAIDITDATKDKGASDLIVLNTAIGALVDAADDAVKSAMAGLTTPKAEKTN